MSQLKNYYDILQIPQNASSYEIEQAYQKLSGIWHPDRHKTHRRSAQVKFHDICEAYQTLSNKNRRAHYDELLSKQYSIQDANKTFQRFYEQYGVQDEAQKNFFHQHYPQRKRNYYDVLEIPRNATFQQIKKAYRRIALKYHPKNNPDNQQAHIRFLQVCEAFNSLEDQTKRQNYNDLIFNRQIAPVRAHDIFQDFWGNKVYEMPNQQQFFKPILKKKWSSTLDRLMDNGDWGNMQNGETVKTSTVYTNNNGIESKKTVTTKRKIQAGLPATTTTEQYEFPNGTKQVRVIKDDGRGNIITDVYNLKKGQKLPISA